MPILSTIALPSQAKPTAATIFLIHGLFGSADNLTSLGKELSQYAHVYLVDALNHGNSPHIDSMNYMLQAQSLIETMNALGIVKASILGHSMGGKIAMATALIAPERVENLVVADMAPVRYSHGHHAEFQGLNHVELTRINSRREADHQLSKYIKVEQIRQFLLKSLLKDQTGWHWKFALKELEDNYPDIVDWPFEAMQFNHPTLFIKAQRSDYISTQYQQAIQQQFPSASLKIIADCGHWLHAEKPRLFNRIVVEYLIQDN
ncbi:alpha/beta fold hydrolase [Celerinatantimonas sp. YJH-8]|uniref:alpha/beta fold hydrolase n=1 Tax=Celerinatantimonas sp. YJH-8 TaxID=3228714 RepID=UPI0038C2B006